MAEIRAGDAADFGVPIDRVFAYRLDFANLPDYNPHVTNLRRVDGGTQPGPGAEYVFDLALPGMDPVEAPLRVLEAAPPVRIVFESGPGYMAREESVFTETPDGTHADFTMIITIPGEIDDATRSMIEQSSREQVALELDLMRKALE